MENYPTVAIIIPTMNREKSLVSTLKSISKLNYPKNKIQIIIIDNASNEPISYKLLVITGIKSKIIRNKKNLGFAPAINQGIKASKSKYVFVTNDDVAFDKNCLSELIKLADSDNKIGIVGGKMFFRDKPKTMSLPGFRVNLWLGYHPYDFRGRNQFREMDVATGGCMLIRRSIFNSIGGAFDEGFFFCGEDYDICFRTKYAGFKVMYCPSAILWHDFSGTGNNKNLFAHYRGKFRFMLVHASIPKTLFFFPVQILLGYKNLRPMISASYWNIKNIRNTLKSRRKVNILKEIN